MQVGPRMVYYLIQLPGDWMTLLHQTKKKKEKEKEFSVLLFSFPISSLAFLSLFFSRSVFFPINKRDCFQLYRLSHKLIQSLQSRSSTACSCLFDATKGIDRENPVNKGIRTLFTEYFCKVETIVGKCIYAAGAACWGAHIFPCMFRGKVLKIL